MNVKPKERTMTTATKPKERGLMFRDELVQAILDGRKTQTRRIIPDVPDPTAGHYLEGGSVLSDWDVTRWEDGTFVFSGNAGPDIPIRKPKVDVGGNIWVKEPWRAFLDDDGNYIDVNYRLGDTVRRLDAPLLCDDKLERQCDWQWKNKMFMPLWASRIVLPVINVKAERLKDISGDDAQAEGAECRTDLAWAGTFEEVAYPRGFYAEGYRAGFFELWDSINKKPGTRVEDNPLVFAYEWEPLA